MGCFKLMTDMDREAIELAKEFTIGTTRERVQKAKRLLLQMKLEKMYGELIKDRDRLDRIIATRERARREAGHAVDFLRLSLADREKHFATLTTKERGRLGEALTAHDMLVRGFEPITFGGPRPQGIDSIWTKGDRFCVVETKPDGGKPGTVKVGERFDGQPVQTAEQGTPDYIFTSQFVGPNSDKAGSRLGEAMYGTWQKGSGDLQLIAHFGRAYGADRVDSVFSRYDSQGGIYEEPRTGPH